MYENIALFMGIAIGAFLLNIVLNSAFLWFASKILKLEKQDRSTAVKTAVVYSIVSILLSAVAFLPSLFLSGGSLTTMLLLVLFAIVGLGLYICLIKRFYEVDWKTALLACLIAFVASVIIGIIIYVVLVLVVMILGVSLWQLGVFNSGEDAMAVAGFVKMVPLTPSIAYSGSKFTVLFANAVGTTVSITDVVVKESISGTTCSIKPLKEPSVRAGSTFAIQGDCGQKNAGETYDLVFNITYSATIGGITTTHTDSGRIKGQAEIERYIDSLPVINENGANGDHETVILGFVKMQPLSTSVSYRSDGAYTVTLTNALGTTMNVTTVSLGVEASKNCGSITVNDESFADSKGNVPVKSGRMIQVKAVCPEKNKGDTYNVSMSIDYLATMGGIVTSHKETGLVKGSVED